MPNLRFSQVVTAWSSHPARRRIALIGEIVAQGPPPDRTPIRHGGFRALVSPINIEWHGVGQRLDADAIRVLRTHLASQAPSLLAALETLYESDLPRGRLLFGAPFRLSGLILTPAAGWWIDPAHPSARASLLTLPNRPLGQITVRLEPGSAEVLILDHTNWRAARVPGSPASLSFGPSGQSLTAVAPILAVRLEDPVVAAVTAAALADLGRPLRRCVDALAAGLARMG